MYGIMSIEDRWCAMNMSGSTSVGTNMVHRAPYMSSKCLVIMLYVYSSPGMKTMRSTTAAFAQCVCRSIHTARDTSPNTSIVSMRWRTVSACLPHTMRSSSAVMRH